MRSNSCIYLLSAFPVFNGAAIPLFNSFNSENSLLFYSTLNINLKEILNPLKSSYMIKFCFDEKDKGSLPSEYLHETEILFINMNNRSSAIKILPEKDFNLYKNNLIIFSNSIGISSKDIIRALNLITMEEDAVVIGKSDMDKITFIGFNSYNPKLFSGINFASNGINYSQLLNNACKSDNFIHVLNNFIFISDSEDFKSLYIELSKKESLNYCSQKMHEKFTNLFIEYKDLLK